MVICALALHEAAHVFAVNYLGGKVEKIGVFPLGLRARFTGLEKLCPWERYVVYSAGSLANLVAAGWMFSVSQLSYFGVPWLNGFAFYNMVLCIFNLTPVLPLDGGRIAHQFLSNRMGMRPANRVMVRLGQALGMGLAGLGVLQVMLYNYNVTLLGAGAYIMWKNRTMAPFLEMDFFKILAAKQALDKGRPMLVKQVHMPAQTPITDAMDYLMMDYMTVFFINEKGCEIPEKMLVAHVFANGRQGTMIDLISTF